MTKITSNEKARYLNDPSFCPKCDSSNIEGGHMEADGKEAWQEVTCNECSFDWHDVYTLTDIYEPESE